MIMTTKQHKEFRRRLGTMTVAQIEELKCRTVKMLDDAIDRAGKSRESVAREKWLRERDETGDS
jgi:hypothetical protein